MMTRTFLASLAAVSVLAGLPAAAQAPRTGEAPRADVTRAQTQERAARMFARLDANHDGRLDQADRAAQRQARFERLDTDRDGSVSRAEFDSVQERRAATRKGPTAQGGERAAPHRERGGHGFGPGRMAHGNKDGAITQAEFTARALASFDRADADRNGTLTAAERQAARERVRSTRRSPAAS